MVEHVELRVQKNLLNPHFDGYKLSLDSLPVYSKELECGLDVVKLTDDQYSYHHAKLFGSHNHLISDPWSPDTIYFIDTEWDVRRVQLSGQSKLEIGDRIFQIPDRANQHLVPGRYNSSLCFAGRHTAVLADGAGNFSVLDTDNRVEHAYVWKAVFSSSDVVSGSKLFEVVSAVQHRTDENHRIECLLVHIEERDEEHKEKYSSPFLTVITWITLLSVDKKVWTVERTRRLEGVKPFDYAVVEKDGSAVLILSEQKFTLVTDSVNPVQSAGEWEVIAKVFPDDIPRYTWSQDSEDINIQFTVPAGVVKADIFLNLQADHIEFGVKNGLTLLKGQVHDRVDVEASTWTIQGQRVELTLSKEVSGNWPEVVLGDTHGEMVLDTEQVAQIHERLAHLTSDQWNPDPESRGEKPYNCQELEDCDDSNDDCRLMRIDGETHTATHAINLGGHQWLFCKQTDSEKPPALCLRHDVDGLLWQPEQPSSSRETLLHHTGTFNAFGYVQASKQQKKFSSCAPNLSYAVICECVRHIYIYRQNSPVLSPLRNRKTGQQVSAIAKQQVVALESTDNILGLHVTNRQIFVATGKTVYAIATEETSG
ncbi:nudC domain-containing protein 1-like [Gigantopelta aegis]|uniref:nudC domain-containing protein 1-like n=1 Tax=Gigantopelta aegis TaxID=1735272 RepID=UPI001B88A70F|nr:nudC domain-containing protein 1-like [Gigantopelta aegis]